MLVLQVKQKCISVPSIDEQNYLPFNWCVLPLVMRDAGGIFPKPNAKTFVLDSFVCRAWSEN
jgi:hypothetical protein